MSYLTLCECFIVLHYPNTSINIDKINTKKYKPPIPNEIITASLSGNDKSLNRTVSINLSSYIKISL